jgi:predicted permease
MNGLLLDFRYAVRSLSRNPVAAIAAVLCLGFGIGANTTMFGIVDRLLFRPPPYVRDPARVVRVLVARTYHGRPPTTGLIGSFPAYLDLADGAGVFDAVATFAPGSADLGRGVDAEQISPGIVTHTFFSLLGVTPALGRFFGPEEDRVGGTPVVVLDYSFWQHRFGGDRGIIGKTLLIGYKLYTVIGVAPRGFTGIGQTAPNVWLPARVVAEDLVFHGALESRGSVWTGAIARLKPGVTTATATAAATLALQRGAATFRSPGGPPTAVLAPLLAARGPNPGDNVRIATWVAGVAAIVLLIACANVANLLLARAANRRREIAIRLALGSGRRRLVRQLLVEGLVLAAAGMVVAVLLALWGGSLIRAMILPNASAIDMVLDLRVLAFTGLVAILTGGLCGLVPALQASRPDLTSALKAGRHEGRLQRSFTRSALLITQVALTVMLLTGAGLFVRSLRNAQARDLGFDVEHIIVATVDLQRAGYDSTRMSSFYDNALSRLRGISGVTHVAVSSSIPFYSARGMGVRVPGMDTLPTVESGGPYADAVSPDYFAAVGRAILRGRSFTEADRPGAPRVVIIGETMARLYWRGENPLGQCVILGGTNAPCSEVVGVTADAYRFVEEKESMTLYLPAAQASYQNFPIEAIEIRTGPRARDLAGLVRREIQGMSADLPYVQASPLEERVNLQYRSWQMGATMFSLFGGLALVLAAIGLYGVLAYIVTQRTREVGIRMALGATRGDVLRLVVGQGLRVVLIGLTIGIAVALVSGTALASLLYGVTPRDPVVLIVAPLTLLAVASVASYLPARRATRVDPALALREE